MSEPPCPCQAGSAESFSDAMRRLPKNGRRRTRICPSSNPLRILRLLSVSNADDFSRNIPQSEHNFVYRALFTSQLSNGVDFEVEISEISTETMQKIVDFVYTRIVELTEEIVVDMITWAHYFGLETLVDICGSFVLRILTPENSIFYMLMAK